ncbi:hypothetical protein ACVRZD_03745 [Streptococcus hongkongensis]
MTNRNSHQFIASTRPKAYKKITIPMVTYYLDWATKHTNQLPYLLENIVSQTI